MPFQVNGEWEFRGVQEVRTTRRSGMEDDAHRGAALFRVVPIRAWEIHDGVVETFG